MDISRSVPNPLRVSALGGRRSWRPGAAANRTVRSADRTARSTDGRAIGGTGKWRAIAWRGGGRAWEGASCDRRGDVRMAEVLYIRGVIRGVGEVVDHRATGV